MSGLRLMAVHAHPDDESSKGAATTARYADEGNEVLVVTLTGGERGSVLNPAMDLPGVADRMDQIRREEMAEAARDPRGAASVGSASSTPACPRATRPRRCPRGRSPWSRSTRRPRRWYGRCGSSART